MPISDRFQNVTTRARLLAIAPLTCFLLSQPLVAQTSALAQAELQRRAANAREAQELLKKGDESYEGGKWKDAVEAYRGARDLLPDAPATAELRKAATERLIQASIEQARHQRRLGDVSGAKETMGKVLAEDVAPDNGLALEMDEQLDDPIRTNPAATLEHGKDIEEVRLLLYKAEGFKNLGDYDKASMVYEDVLRVDPTNKAARRGMEEVSQLKADYYRAAHDEARAVALAEVDEAWQLRVTPKEDVGAILEASRQQAGTGDMLLASKMDRIILPVISFDNVKIQEAFDFLRAQSIERDTIELDPARKGVNFVLNLGDAEAAKGILEVPISLELRNVPLSQVVKYIADVTRTIVVPQEFAVEIRSAAAGGGDMITRTYRVPPDFLSQAGSAAGGAGELDPFEEKEASEGLLAARLSATDALKNFGVSFPEGASANFNATTSTLRVTNTAQNLAMVEQAVDQANSTTPTMVAVQVRMIKIQENSLDELGFDWMLDDFSLGGTGLTPGTTAGHLSGGTQNPANMADMPLAPGSIFQHAITSGNRSGTEAVTGDAIDARILEQQQGFGPSTSRAPGVAWMNGIINNTNVTMMMRGLAQKKGVDIVVSPSTVTRSGQQSTIEVMREFIYPTEYEPPELPNSVGSSSTFIDLDTGEIFGASTPLIPITPATPTSFEMEKVGVILDVLPTVSADGHFIDVALKPSITDFDGFINYGTPITSPAPQTLGSLGGFASNDRVVLTDNQILMPVFSKTQLDTNLTIANGATFAVGGLLQARMQKVEDHTKILGELPVVGRLFKSEVTAPSRTLLLFLVTVKVLDPTGESVQGN